MTWILTAIQGLATLTASLPQSQTNGNATYGILGAPTLPKFLGSQTTDPPWGSTQPGNDIPNTGVTRYYNFSVSRDYKTPDGYNKSVILVNDQFPGPLIEANWGDTIEVTLTNNIDTEALTLHWHGQPQRLSPGQDGTPGVSQCPIAPNDTSIYSFRAENFGTGWYHSHVSGQYTDGLYGPMVVYGPTQLPYDIDLGPIMLSDYNHDNYLDLIEHAASVEPTFPVIDNNLINGKGIYNCSLQPSHDCCPYAGLSKFTFYPSKTHRLRLINTGNDGTQKFTIDGHNFTVIANDYVPVQPYTTDVVTLAVGQRTDILVTGTGKGAYWMRSDFDVSCLNLTAINNHALAAIYYVGTNTSSIPTTEATPWQSNNCANDPLNQTVPYYPMEPPASPSVTSIFNVTLRPNATGHFNFFVNDSSFEADYNSPLLLNAMKGNTSFPQARNVYDYSGSTTVRVILETDYAVVHPMHLHGHDFWVLAQGYGKWDGQVQGNSTNPQRRDTQLFLRPPSDGQPSYTVLEWYADNPGIWPLHCHTSIHVSGGLLFNVLERSDLIREASISSATENNCKSWSKWTTSHTVDQIDSGLR